MIDPTITTLLTTAMEKTVNFALKYDPASRHALTSIDGTVLLLKSHSPSVNMSIQVREDTIGFFCVPKDELNNFTSDVQLEGELEDLIALTFTSQHSLSNTNVKVSGKISTISKFQEIFEQLDIDWEDALTEYLGTVPGHQLAQIIRAFTKWSNYQKKSIQNKLPDYLTEELKIIPGKAEFELFVKQVEQLRSATDRIEARILRIQKHLINRA